MTKTLVITSASVKQNKGRLPANELFRGRLFKTVKDLCEKSGLSIEDFELIEVNEAFAAQYIACERELGLNRDITNVNGSGIGLGHPVGSTGARLIVTLIYAMKRRGKSLGLATLCGGGGVSMACAIEMV